MDEKSSTPLFGSLAKDVVVVSLISLSFAINPYFCSDQHTYLFHALAQFHNSLQNDVMFTWADPVPVFTYLCSLIYGLVGKAGFYLLNFALLAVAVYSLIFIAQKTLKLSKSELISVTVAFAFFNSDFVFSYFAFTGREYGFPYQIGFAGQAAISTFLRPSCFGILFILSIAGFVSRRYLLAVVSITAAILFHPTYLISGIVLGASYIVILIKEGELGGIVKDRVFQLICLLCFVALALLGYYLLVFLAQDSQTAKSAQNILFDFRIPHHANPKRWLANVSFAGQGRNDCAYYFSFSQRSDW